MYLAQGIPWGFMVTSVAAYLAEHGVDDAEIANLIAAVMYPWTFKLVWAPLINRSPLGQFFLGANVDDELDVVLPGGTTRYKILAIESVFD